MIYEIDDETIDFLCKLHITFNQFSLCLIIQKQDYGALYKYSDHVGYIGNCLIPPQKIGGSKDVTDYVKEIDDLFNKGLIKTTKPSAPYELDYLLVTDKFTKSFISEPSMMAQELWDAYPKNIVVNGITYPTKACDFEDFKDKYIKSIRGNFKIHKNLVLPHIVKEIKDNNGNPKMNIMNYVGGRNWEGTSVQQPTHKSRSI